MSLNRPTLEFFQPSGIWNQPSLLWAKSKSISYMHHLLKWRSAHQIKILDDQNVLFVHLANDGFLYISDEELHTTAWRHANNRHPGQEETGSWTTIKTAHRDEAWRQLSDFTLFAQAWFGPCNPFHKYFLYHAHLRRIDVCFLSKDRIGLSHIALEFSFERDWPVADESELWF